MDLFSHVGGAVEAGEGPVGVDEPDYEGDAIGGPAGVIDEVGEDKLCGLTAER